MYANCGFKPDCTAYTVPDVTEKVSARYNLGGVGVQNSATTEREYACSEEYPVKYVD
jgi:hypothetical protein